MIFICCEVAALGNIMQNVLSDINKNLILFLDKYLIISLKYYCRLRDERGDERVISLDQKSRDHHHSHNGSPNGHSPVLNLSKSGQDHGSVGEPSERSDHSPDPSIRDDDDNLSNASDVDDHHDKDEGE